MYSNVYLLNWNLSDTAPIIPGSILKLYHYNRKAMLRLEDKPRSRLKSFLNFSRQIHTASDEFYKLILTNSSALDSIELSLSPVSHRKFKFGTGLMKRDIKKPQMPTTQKGFMSHVSKNRSHNSSKKKKATACAKKRSSNLRVPRKLKLLGW